MLGYRGDMDLRCAPLGEAFRSAYSGRRNAVWPWDLKVAQKAWTSTFTDHFQLYSLAANGF